MARSRNRYSRARIRARARKPRRTGSSRWFYGALALIVAAFMTILVLTVSDRSAADVPPQPGNPNTNTPGDHWHAAFKVNVCGEWLSDPPTFEEVADNPNVKPGIHTHGDGFIHIHPFTRSEGGDNATLGRFLDYGGWSASEDSLNLWTGPTKEPAKTSWSDGDTCPAGSKFAEQKGRVVWSIDCKTRSGNPSDVKLRDHQVIALGFLPKGKKLGVPPNASATPAQDQSSQPTPINNKACSSAGPGATESTTTSAPTATTAATTTAPPSSTP
jgi:hypothetical protein